MGVKPPKISKRQITINLRFGLIYGRGEPRDPDREMAIYFGGLKASIEKSWKAEHSKSRKNG